MPGFLNQIKKTAKDFSKEKTVIFIKVYKLNLGVFVNDKL